MVSINGIDGEVREVARSDIVGLSFGVITLVPTTGWRFLTECGITIRGDLFIATERSEVNRVALLLGVA